MGAKKGPSGGVPPSSAAGEFNRLSRDQKYTETVKSGGNKKSASDRRDTRASSAFAKAAAGQQESLDSAGEESNRYSSEPQGLGRRSGDLASPRRLEKKKSAKKTQERGKGARGEGGRWKKKENSGWRKWVAWFGAGVSLRRAAALSVNLLIAVAILGVFLLKAAEEYYGSDVDGSGHELDQHLAALDLEHGSTEADIRRAYRSLSVKWHPDRNPDCGASCQQRFQDIAAAYEFLMRRERRRKQRSGEGNLGEGEGGDKDELKTTSKGIVDLSDISSDEPFFPAVDTKHVWTVMIHQDKDDWSESVYEMWQESARTMGKYVKFGVIILRGRNKEILKKLPVNIKFFPAILLMGGGMAPEQYPLIARPAAESINRFITEAFPSTVDVATSARELRKWLAAGPSLTSNLMSAPYKLVIFASPSSPQSPSFLVKHAAYSNKQTFRFCYVRMSKEVYEREREELLELLRQPPVWLPQREKLNVAEGGMLLPVFQQAVDPKTIGASTVFGLFADEGAGISRVQRSVVTPRSKALDGWTAVNISLQNLRDIVTPLLFQQNVAYLCRNSPLRRVACVVSVQLPDKETDDAGASTADERRVIDLALIKKLLSTSRTKYLQDNPRKDIESVWRRALERERRMQEKSENSDEEVDPNASTDEEESLGDPEESIHIQVVRLSLAPPRAISSLPGIPADSSFFKLWKEELGQSRIFLLDLDEGRIAPLPHIYVDSPKDSAETKQSVAVYEHLYQLFEESDGSNDSDGSVGFKPLPSYCSPKNFAKNCLSSAQPSWWLRMLGTVLEISILQVVLVLALVVGAWAVKSRLTAEIVLPGIIGMSICVYFASSLSELLSPFFASK